MWSPKEDDWYEVDPREFGNAYVQVAWASGGQVCVESPDVGYFKIDLDAFMGCTRGPLDPVTGELV